MLKCIMVRSFCLWSGYHKPTFIHSNFISQSFGDIMKIHWFWVTIFCNQDVYYLENNRDNQFAVKNIRNDEALTNLIKISRSWIKVGLQWLNWTSFFITTNCNFLSLYDRARKNKFKNWCWIFSTKKFSQ